MWEVITRPLLLLALDEVALVSEDVTKQLRALFEFAVEDVYPTLPVEQAPVGMPAKVHFATFVAAFLATLEYGMEGAQAVCKKTGFAPCQRSSNNYKKRWRYTCGATTKHAWITRARFARCFSQP